MSESPQKRSKSIHAAVISLEERAKGLSLEQVLRATLDEAEALTGSCIGFYHFVEQDQENLLLQAWSTRTEAQFCKAEGKGMHYPVSKAGVWADCLRVGHPLIHNDYQSLPIRHGLPPGHATVLRELVVPVRRSGQVVAVLGVGNKATDYDESDIESVQLLADLAWHLAEGKRLSEALVRSETKFRTLFETNPDAVMLLDGHRIFDCNQAALDLFGCATREDFCKCHPADLSPDAQPCGTKSSDMASRHVAAAIESGHHRFEWVHKRTDTGACFPAEVVLNAMEFDGKRVLQGVVRDISERRNAVEALRKSEVNFRQAQKVAHVGSWTWDIQAGHLAWSDEMYRIFGIEKGQFHGLLSEIIEKAIHPEDRDVVEKSNLSVTQKGIPIPLEYRVVWPDGTVRVVWAEAGDLKLDEFGNAAVLTGIVQDITERKQAEQALVRSHALLENLASLVPGVVYQYRLYPDGRSAFPYSSPGMNDIYEVTPDEVRLDATPVFGRLHPEDYQSVAEAIQHSAQTLEEFFAEFRVNLPRQGLRWRWSQAHPQRMEDGGTLWHGIILDITDRKQGEEEHRSLQTQLQQSQKMESLGTLAGGVAHDMNNVLGAILGLASANLKVLPPDSPTYRAFETISKAATRGGEMVKGLLTFARRSQAEERVVDLNQLLTEEVRLLERTTLSKVRCEMDLEQELSPISGDASALTHALMNLCVNAVDAMPENGTLTLRTRNVDREWVEVVVEDTGRGMPQEVLERAMEPFFTTKATGEGTGLGLSLVYSTVKAHLGQIDIQSQPGLGTKVSLRFPACAAATETAKTDLGTPEEGLKQSLDVLLIDDDELIHDAMAFVLETLGHRAVLCLSGEEALEQVQQGFRPNIVILDMNMPGLGGSGTLPRLRALLPTVPILLSSGRTDQAALDLCRAHPFVALLPKPFSIEEIQQHLDAVD